MLKFFLIFTIFHNSASCVRQFLNIDTFRDSSHCGSEECFHAAKSYHSSISYFLDPCDNFYDFVCFGWKNQHKIPSKKSRWNNFVAQHFRVLGQLHQSLEYLHRPERKIEWKVINLYKGCMNEIKRESLHVEPLRQVLKKIGGWPLIGDDFDESSYDWLGTLALMSRNIGISNVIFHVKVDSDPKNSTKNVLFFDAASDNGVKNIRQNNAREENIGHSEIFRTVSKFRSTIAVKDIQEMKEVLKFESALDSLTSYYFYSLPNERFVLSNISELQEVFGNEINITSYMQKILQGIIQVRNETGIMTPHREIIEVLSRLIENTTNRVIANFIGWKIAETLSSLTISEFRQSRLQIVEVPIGSEVDMPLHEHCVAVTDDLLTHALGSIYVKDHFGNEYVKDLHEMVSLVKSSFQDIIEESQWMDSKTKQKALLKLKSMRQVIGYPKWIVDNKQLDKYYETLGDVREDNFFQSALNVLQFKRNKELMKLMVPFDDNKDWIRSPFETNAYYDFTENGLFYPFALTQWPFYQYGLPQYINLGAFGTIIGHEMTHGFDTKGYKYGETGSIRDWWTPEAKQKFENKSKCFVRQYEDYEPITGHKVNGYQTLAENIADNAGVRDAFRAWKKYEKRRGDYHNKRLPLLEFTKDQLFFIAYAYVWCSNENSVAMLARILSNEHAPAKDRVIGALSNNRDFYKAFNCTKGDRMYREDQCILW